MAGDVFDEEGFPVTQRVEMFQLEINRPVLVNEKYMVTYEGYTLTDSPRPGQQNYILRFEPIDGSVPFYMEPEVYPMLTTSTRDNIDWSVDPHVRTGRTKDIYLYVAGSRYVARKNDELERRNRTGYVAGESSDEDNDIQTIEIKMGETIDAGPFSFSFINFIPASEEVVPENTQIGIRALLRVEHEPSGNAFEIEPLFAVYTENEQSYVYSPPLDIEQWEMSVLFSRIHPESDSIELTVYGLDEEFEEDWILVVAEIKPFVSVVWLGTFLIMIGFSVSLMRHWKREKNTKELR
jgi:cytochrome c-type biogenesis protein CcmF